jgi:hypothetical protein
MSLVLSLYDFYSHWTSLIVRELYETVNGLVRIEVVIGICTSSSLLVRNEPSPITTLDDVDEYKLWYDMRFTKLSLVSKKQETLKPKGIRKYFFGVKK